MKRERLGYHLPTSSTMYATTGQLEDGTVAVTLEYMRSGFVCLGRSTRVFADEESAATEIALLKSLELQE